MTAQLEQRLFTVDEVERMVQAGVFNEDDRLELIEGVLVKMSPQGARHSGYIDRVSRFFHRLDLPDTIVRVQSSIQLGPHTAPEPDIAILRFREDFYEDRLPGPKDVLLAIEVSETTLAADRKVKMPLYAKAGIPEAWVLDVVGKAIEQYSEPRGRTYRSVRRYGKGEDLVSVAFPGLVISTNLILR
jgi:Uma2 family endonuclease